MTLDKPLQLPNLTLCESRENLLKAAAQTEDVDKTALRLARKVLTEESATSLFKTLSAVVARRTNQIQACIYGLALAFGIVSVANGFGIFLVNATRDFHVLCFLGFATVLAVIVLQGDMLDKQAEAEQLEPIQGTDMCRTALRFVEHGGPAARAWRDIAVADRGQLYAFDIEVMSALLDHSRDNESVEEKERLNKEAGLRVHALSEKSTV